ncbi:MAG: ABC transporter ATP-binding protein [Candidatus Thermoplasmatota archaeon]|nr:ABC transporter ATP-binding protein [Candidatus Thermoplasmatota archaeon]
MKVELKRVERSYGSGPALVRALKGVSMRIKEGDSISVMGPSGSGKTTLMYIIGLLEKPSSGDVSIDGRSIKGCSDWYLSKMRLKRIGFVFQQFHLLPNLNAMENVMVPMRESGIGRAKSRKMACELLDSVGILNRAKHLPSRMSGGEQQRTAIARAIANGPEMILADEPTGELDSDSSGVIMDILTEMNRAQGKTLIVVTHDPEVARRSRKIMRMKDGSIHS